MKNLFNFRNSIILLIILLIAFFAWSKISKIMKANDPVIVTETNYDHVIGKSDAKVTVVEFADFQCPACKAFEEVISPIMTEYSDRVKFVFKHFPLTQIHQNAMTASLIAESAGIQGKFWEAKKVMYEKQEEWGASLEAKDKLLTYMETLGLDIDKLKLDMTTEEVKSRVTTNLKEATSLQLPGTPSIIINGIKVSASSIGTPELFKKYLDEKLGVSAENTATTTSTVKGTSTEVELSTSSVKVMYDNSTKTKSN